MDNEYYILDKGGRIGPFTPRELMARPLEPGDLLLQPSQTQGVPAYSLPEFDSYFKSEGIYYPTQQNTNSYMLRLPAAIIDFFVLAIPLWILACILFPQYILSLQPDITSTKISYQQLMQKSAENMLKHQTEFFIIEVAFFLVTILYNTLCEASHLRASVGKYLLGLAVVDELGYSLTFLHALKRNLGKFIYEVASFFISILAYTAYSRMIWSDRHQAFHDMFSGCYIVKKNQ
ncbi:putative RDD family membrane protein YckC [Mucilaginibacter gracilis]|uniref:Putative RDD family membrane protein YckC n=1 Tax=Mucilaginibacter gracilis TaxID=423350 RepID=A0A495J993_9SPHI|nr:RDD family protein [Mucilaginibacter gracilis]RKR85048.1 putative RDD family membrane protein YckC [Mucilaginibacter gracilis]